jgi:hypothetical protein
MAIGLMLAACRKPGQPASASAPSATDTLRRDTMSTMPDSLTGMMGDTMSGMIDSLSADGKISSKPRDRREAPRHGSPDQAEIDSLKKAKGGKKAE